MPSNSGMNKPNSTNMESMNSSLTKIVEVIPSMTYTKTVKNFQPIELKKIKISNSNIWVVIGVSGND